jgi:hypothetical protein
MVYVLRVNYIRGSLVLSVIKRKLRNWYLNSNSKHHEGDNIRPVKKVQSSVSIS